MKQKPARRRDKMAALKATDLTRFGLEAEQEFQAFLCRHITMHGPISSTEAICEGAYAANVGITTARKYLMKHTTSRAHFFVNSFGQVDCRTHGEANPGFGAAAAESEGGRR